MRVWRGIPESREPRKEWWRRLDVALRGLSILGLIFYLLPNAAHAQDELIILSPHWEGIRSEFGAGFASWYSRTTGRTVTVDWRDMGGATDDLRFILSEYQQTPSSIGIDLFFGGGSDPYLDLKGKGHLAPFHPSKAVLDAIPATLNGLPLYDPEGAWFGTALSSFGILRNDRVVRQMNLPAVSTWKDLTQPGLEGWVGSGDPRNSGATHMVYEAILQAYGWEGGWSVISGMAANVRQFDRNGSTTAKSCTLGNVAYALVVDFYGFTQIAEAGQDNMSLVLPPGESILNPDGIGILKGAPHQAIAEKFVEFVLSEEGQSLWLAPIGNPAGPRKFGISRMAIRPDLYERFATNSPVKINPFRDLQPLKYDSKLGAARWSALNGLLGALVMDKPRSQRKKVRVPISEEELTRVAAKEWRDPIRRNEIQLSWQETR